MGGRGGSYSRSGFLGPHGKQKPLKKRSPVPTRITERAASGSRIAKGAFTLMKCSGAAMMLRHCPASLTGPTACRICTTKTAGLQSWTAQKQLTFLPETPFRKWRIKWRTGATVPAQSFASNGQAAGPAMYLWPNSKRAAQSSWTRRPGAMLTSTSIWIRRSRARLNLSGSTT